MNQAELFSDLQGKTPTNPGTIDQGQLFELSINAFYAALYADLSELPIKAEIGRFVEKVKKAGNEAAGGSETARILADRAASDRGDPDVLVVLKASSKVQREIHHITGFLRFSPGPDGVYTARCAPDHFVLPALAEHFTLRFGETPWAIIDEKRGLCLSRKSGGQAQLAPASDITGEARPVTTPEPAAGAVDHWEDLWRLYHRSVNNEARKNPRLQRQLMPERYQKYLVEMG